MNDATGKLAHIHHRARVLLGAGSAGAAGATDDPAALVDLTTAFELSPLDEQILMALFAAEIDPAIRLVERAVQRDASGWMEVGTLAELLEMPSRWLGELVAALSGPLVAHGLVWVDDAGDAPWPMRRLKLPAEIVARLQGQATLPPGFSWAQSACDTTSDELGPARIALARATAADVPVVVEILTADADLGVAAVATLASELGLRALIVDGKPDTDSTGDSGLVSRRWAAARREARLRNAFLVLRGWSALPPEQKPHQSMALLCSTDAPPRLDAARVRIQLKFPSSQARAHILRDAILARGLGAPDEDSLLDVAVRFPLPSHELRVAARQALPVDGFQVSADDLARLCADRMDHDLDDVAVRVPCRQRWEDLVVSENVYESLCEMIARIRFSDLVLDDWAVGRRTGVARGFSALFSGPPGTGKTMCASVIATELGIDLFRVDLSRVLSKWIGETEKNLGRVFDQAERSGAAILFDEADSLFAKRTEVKSSVDRYANVEVNYLLQRIENFPGVILLTTNREDGIDEAFKRRLAFRVRFDAPDAFGRAALWEKLLSGGCPRADDIDVHVLAERFVMAGGDIKNAMVRAAFLAAAAGTPIDMRLCLQAAEREYVEMGRLTCAPQYEDDEPATDIEPEKLPRREPQRRQPLAPPRVRPIAVSHPRRRVATAV